ncbi:MAG: HlyC/CorC family transporter [Abitibacteriaceae bacterium]|nr:HlyC/CorC family transporter [Abditibacteriaceae bacterium]MBV9867572.1 HlyC/CorC family transporter [Abditibacteriaceae bacterium]
MDHPPPANIAVQLLTVFALVLANGFFVASEFCLVSLRKTRIDQLASEGHSGARAVQRALHDITRYIAATQVGISIVSLLLGGLGEQALEPLLAPLFSWISAPWMGITRTGVATFFAYFIMTTMHVVIGELLPKSIALQKADTMALWLVRPLNWFTTLVTPLVWMLNILGGLLLRLLGIHPADGHTQVHSPEELDLLFEQSREGGALNETEFEILHRVVRFSDTTAREVMVPRVEMQAIPLEMSRRELNEYLRTQPHTRVPVYRGSLDDLVGIAHLKDLVLHEASLDLPATNADGVQTSHHANGAVQPALDANASINLMPLVREAARVPETITIDRLLILFKHHRQQMAIVIDEYGGTAGLVTMGDLLEQVFGDVGDEFDAPEQEIVPRPDGRILLAGRVLIDEINDRYDLDFDADEADTMAGLVLGVLGRPAVVGDEVEINQAHLRVEDVDRLRITQLSLQLPPAQTDQAEATS